MFFFVMAGMHRFTCDSRLQCVIDTLSSNVGNATCFMWWTAVLVTPTLLHEAVCVVFFEVICESDIHQRSTPSFREATLTFAQQHAVFLTTPPLLWSSPSRDVVSGNVFSLSAASAAISRPLLSTRPLCRFKVVHVTGKNAVNAVSSSILHEGKHKYMHFPLGF